VPALGVLAGLILGLVAGGRLDNLVYVRLRWLPVLLLAAVARFALDAALSGGGLPGPLRLWAVVAIYALLTATLLANARLPGMMAAALGTAGNGIAIALNGGWMPVWQPSLAAAGLDSQTLHSSFHTILAGPVDASFFAHGGPLADVIPVPIPLLRSVVSLGDLLLGAGLAFFVFAAIVRAPAVAPRRAPPLPADLLLPAEASPFPALAVPAEVAVEWAGARHPYVRLATNGPFSAMWLGQLISSLGDRVHQIALVFLVAGATHASPLAMGLVFAAMTVPSFLVGPLAGALVDRWDRKRVMVGSDVARAAIVIAIPAAASLHISLVFGLVFLLAAVSSFFRPARVAALPQVVPGDDLLTANSAMWIADTASDLVGYGLGGLFVAFLGSSLSLAFWLDGASYLASAALVAAVVIPPLALAEGEPTSIRADLVAGWRFLRAETVLFATTVQAAVAEYGLGALTALSPLLIAALPLGEMDAPTAYGLFEMTMGVGLVSGGVVLGGLAERLPKGPSIIAAFTVTGVTLIALAVSGNLLVALALAGVAGVANVTFVVPSQTIFQQRTPGELLGRVVAIRLAVVNGVLAVAMVTSGFVAELFGFRAVLLGCGVLTALAGLAGLLVRPIRRA
jgi:DHA3 family macrolide efflux protein-like MFS transporter